MGYRSAGANIPLPVKRVYKFPDALFSVFKDAINNFSNLKGEFMGAEDGMNKYKTNIILDKSFRSPYIFQNGNEWEFVFINFNRSN